ncbi:MAG TPA: hypothetical protein VF138_06625 [Caulobacteraceae bacterium]
MADPDVLQKIWRMERELGLLERTVAGVQYWPLFRGDLYRPGGEAPAQGLRDRADLLIRAQARRLTSPAWGEARTIVVPFHRKLAEGRDPFTETLLSQPALGPFLALELLIARERLAPRPGLAVSFLEQGALKSAIEAVARHGELMGAMTKEHAELDAGWTQLTGAPFPLSARRMALRLARFKSWTAELRGRFAATGARRLITTFHLPPAIAAAKAAGMEVVEVQHGAITPQDLQHHYPGRPRVAIFPDQLWTFGRYWSESIEAPANCRAAAVGSARIEAMRREGLSKTPRTALVSSHLPNDGRLFEAAVELARTRADWTFTFRPHPEEDLAEYRRRLPPLANLRLSPAEEDGLRLLASREVHIGVRSTMLFEGMALGARTIVLGLPGAEMLAGAVQAGDASLAASAAEAAAMLDSAPRAEDGERYFSPPATGDELLSLLARG